MSRLARRQSTAKLIEKLLSDSSLPAQIASLPPREMRALVATIGLEDAGEVLSLATPEQLTELFDADLWVSDGPGGDEHFDVERFSIWLEVLAEGGLEQAAERLSTRSEDFLAFALSKMLLVLDVAFVERSIDESEHAEQLDKRIESQLSEEIGDYLVVARVHDGWDTLLGVLLAWDQNDDELLGRLLRRLSGAGELEADDAGGLSELLDHLETLEEDATAEREARRAAQGYVAPAEARAFLRLAREVPLEIPGEDAISRAHFRELDVGRKRQASTRRNTQKVHVDEANANASELRGPSASVESGAPSEALVQLLAHDGHRPEPRLTGVEDPPLARVLREVAADDSRRHARLLDELAFLTNVLISGDDSRATTWTPEAAAREVVSVIDRVLPGDSASARSVVDEWGLIGLFRLGFRAQPSPPQSTT